MSNNVSGMAQNLKMKIQSVPRTSH